MTRVVLLPENALSGKTVGLSVSESADLNRLGLTETHFRLALAEITRCILLAGGNIAYGGHLDPDGYTAFMFSELQKYGRRDRPLKVYLAWPEHRRLSLCELREHEQNLGLFGEVTYLSPEGTVIDPYESRGEDPQPEPDEAKTRQSYTSLRNHMTANIDARVLLGGKTEGFKGDLPGLAEEALLSCEAKQPLYVVGGFGGMATATGSALEIFDTSWLPSPCRPKEDLKVEKALSLLKKKITDSPGCISNGLDADENEKLGAAFRPSDVAALISVGLGRYFDT